MVQCDVCKGTDFTLAAGFYFCVECGTKSQEIREVEHTGGAFDKSVDKTVIKTPKKGVETVEPTSWEEYNYILIGMVKELINNCGAVDALKLTTFQLWTTYLSKMEVAFFSKRDTAIPKLGSYIVEKDATIIYKYKKTKTKKRRPRSEFSSPGSLSSSNTLKKTKKLLLKAEYERFQECSGSISNNLSGSLTTKTSFSNSLTDVSDDENVLKFSRFARKNLKLYKKKILRKTNTEPAVGYIKNKNNKPRNRDYDSTSRILLYGLLYLALNHCQDSIQLGDILRFLKEGHLTFSDIAKFFPENLSGKCLTKNFPVISIMCHEYMREYIGGLAKLLNYNLSTPDINKLCQRYLKELNLPSDINKMIEILIAICPPKMAFKRKQARPLLPNYEARAMAYIIFALKLLFGIDDRKEEEIAKSAMKINEKLETLDPTIQKLFVWTEWIKYIEMRNTILSKCHFQTANAEASTERNFTQLYAEHLMMSKTNEDDEETTNTTTTRRKRITRTKIRMENVKLIFKEIVSKHHPQKNTNLLNFRSSLTPHHSYFDYILNHEMERRKFNIPEYMHKNHCNTDILSFLRPNKLRQYFRKFGINLIVNELPFGDHIKFEQPFTLANDVPLNWNDLIKIQPGISKKEWVKKNRHICKIKKMKEHEKTISTDQHIRKIVVEELNAIENNTKIEIEKKKQNQQQQCNNSAANNVNPKRRLENVEDSTLMSDIFSLNSNEYANIVGDLEDVFLEPCRDDEIPPIFEYISDNDDENITTEINGENLQFEVSNFDYWLKFGTIQFNRKNNFNELMQQKFPKSFQWLLKQCAQIIETSERDVYVELMILENYFAHILESFSKMNKNQLLVQDCNKYRQFGARFFMIICKLLEEW